MTDLYVDPLDSKLNIKSGRSKIETDNCYYTNFGATFLKNLISGERT